MNLIEKAAKFTIAFSKWLMSGGKYRSDEKIDEIFKMCKSNKCGEYIEITEEKGQCGLCGCYLKPSSDKNFNKIAMSTEQCPREPPLWLAEQESQTAKSTPAPSKKGCGCRKKR